MPLALMSTPGDGPRLVCFQEIPFCLFDIVCILVFSRVVLYLEIYSHCFILYFGRKMPLNLLPML